MRRALVLVLATGCQRDLSIPPESDLAFLERSPAVAPLETIHLGVEGGRRPYACSVPVAVSGAPVAQSLEDGCSYTAGAGGPASDLVRVTDARNTTVELHVAVGPPLSVSPRSVFLGPGGRASFVATGGKGPYRLAVVEGPGTAEGTDYLAPRSGGCEGVVAAPAQARLELEDSTAAPPISLAVSIGRGLDLFPAAGDGAVAPHEHLAFVASGGQPPYEYSLQEPAPSGSPGVDAGRGTYRAGPVGNVTDRVQVEDANEEVRCFDVRVGAPLSAALSSEDPRPAQPLRIDAAGGRPPYRFGFAFKGNRSDGSVDPVTGVYTPGLNALAVDRLVVSDATADARVGPLDVQVGPLQVATDAVSTGCEGADVNGDGLEDLIWSRLSFTTAGYESGVAISRVGALPEILQYTTGGSTPPVVADVDQDGLADLVYLADTGVRTLLGSRDGRLLEGPTLSLPLRGLVFAVARGDPRVFFVSNAADCGLGNGIGATSIDSTTGEFRQPSCLAAIKVSVRQLAAGDFNGDGFVDLAYVEGSKPERLLVRMGAAVNAYATELSVALGGTWRLEAPSSLTPRTLREVRKEGAQRSDLVALVIDAPRAGGSFGTGIASFSGFAGGLALNVVAPVVQGAYNLLGINLLGLGAGRRPRLAAWNGTDGTSVLYDLPFGPRLPDPSVVFPARRFRVSCVAGGDFDGDGIEDAALLPRDSGGRGDVLRGEGDGTYGRRPRYVVATAPYLNHGDIDGDGVSDYIAGTAENAFQVYFAGGGQVAVGPRTPVAGQFVAGGSGDFDGDGAADVIARTGSEGLFFFQGRPERDGRFRAGVPLAVKDAAGQPFATNMASLVRAELGGASPGPDLLSLVRLGSQIWVAALRIDDAGHATVGIAPELRSSYMNAADLDGDGIDDVLEIATSGESYVSLVRPDDVGSSTWPFTDWVRVGDDAYVLASGSIRVPGSPRRRMAVIGIDSMTLVDAEGGVPTGIPVPVTSAPLGGDPYDAALADVDGDGATDLVARDSPGAFVVYRGTTDGALSPSPDALVLPEGLAVASFAFVPGTSPAPDLVVELARGGWLVLHNDGTGAFR